MAFPEDILSGLLPWDTDRRYEGAELSLEAGAWAEPVSSDEIVEHLKLPSGNMEAAKLTKLARVARLILEKKYGLVAMDSEYVQTMDTVNRTIKLLIKPVISITEVAIILNTDSDTFVPYTNYGTIGLNNSGEIPPTGYVFTRGAWPSHRGFKSFRIRMHAGFKTKGAADTPALAAARAAVPEDFKTAIMTLAGFLYESREGSVIESDSTRNIANEFNYTVKTIPAAVVEMMEQFTDWSL